MAPTRLPYGISFLKYGINSANYQFAAADSTPDVSLGTVFLSHSSAATITNFDGGEDGKVIFVIAASGAVTTISNNATISVDNIVFTNSQSFIKISSTGGNLVMDSNEVVGFLRQNGIWKHIGVAVRYT